MQKVYITIITLVVLSFFGYNIFLSPAEVTTGSAFSSQARADRDILSLVERLKTISIDQSFFSSALFMSLKDFSVTSFPESQGRTNPFAPIGE